MKNTNQVYVKLQKHLDNQAVGFPATRSGVEIKILKHIFTPAEAEIACCLSYRFEPLETIFNRVGHLVDSAAELEMRFDRIQQKGGIESKIKHRQMHYCNASLAFFYIDKQVAARNRQTRPAVGQFYDFGRSLFYTGISADADAKGDRPGHSQKVSTRYTIVTAGGLLMMCVIHNFTFPNELNPS